MTTDQRSGAHSPLGLSAAVGHGEMTLHGTARGAFDPPGVLAQRQLMPLTAHFDDLGGHLRRGHDVGCRDGLGAAGELVGEHGAGEG